MELEKKPRDLFAQHKGRNSSNSCQDISLKPKDVSLMGVIEDKGIRKGCILWEA